MTTFVLQRKFSFEFVIGKTSNMETANVVNCEYVYLVESLRKENLETELEK